MDDPDRVFRKQKIVNEFGKGKVTTIDLAESFFAGMVGKEQAGWGSFYIYFLGSGGRGGEFV